MEFNASILLIGEDSQDNNQLRERLATNLECQSYCVSIERVATIKQRIVDDNLILLINAEGLLTTNVVDVLEVIKQNFATEKIAFFNVDPDIACDKLLLSPQVRGIFYAQAEEKNILSGIKQVYLNQYWLPRKVMAQFLRHLHNMPDVDNDSLSHLTRREKDILTKICDGRSNLQIADELRVSLSTVKTHTYNLFKKLKVSNRVQAVNIVRDLAGSGTKGAIEADAEIAFTR